MFKFFKVSLLLVLILGLNQNTYAFDLKSLTDKIQKELNVPNNSGSNSLGGMLKSLNQNKSNTSSSNVTSGGNSQPNSSKSKLAKGLCEPDIPQILKNLPEGNIADLESDFSKKSQNITKILQNIPNTDDDQYVSSLKTFEGAFETREVELLFGKFLQTQSINDLSKIKALSMMKPGFNKNKKQIKVDAKFAYGLIHYYYRNVGGNKNLGINYIKKAANSPDNIGALTVYGAWQFNGINVKQNIESGNMGALTGYQRAGDKKLKLNRDGPFKGLKAFEWAETIFLSIAADKRNPYRAQYQGQLAKAAQMKKDLEKDLANSEKYDPKGGWWPFVNQQQDRQHQIISMLADNIGIGEQVSELKAQYRVLKGKVDTDNSLVERKVIINKEMKEKVLKALNSRDTVDEKGKLQIANLAHDNEVLILNNDAIMIKMMAEMMMSGSFGGGAGFGSTVKIIGIMGQNEKIACDIYSGVKGYAARTKITMLKPVTSKNVKTKSRFRKNKS